MILIISDQPLTVLLSDSKTTLPIQYSLNCTALGPVTLTANSKDEVVVS